MKRVFSRAFGFVLALFIVTGCVPESGQASEFKEGTDYKVISPSIPVQASADKVEVSELFWYGCPHCYHLEPTISKFLQKKPENVEFRRVPATLSPRWAFHARLFYVGQMLDPDGSKHVHIKLFEALQKQHRKIDNDDALRRFFTGIGFSADQVNNALKSMELNAMMVHADEVGKMSKADSVPMIIINGKYLTSPSMVGNEERLLQVMDYLIKREAK